MQVRGHAVSSGHCHHVHRDNIYLTSTNKNDAGVRITRIGLYVNLVMAIGKAIGGWTFSSQALTADALHSLSDLISDLMTLATVTWSLKPPTPHFPFGFGKIESIGSVAVSGLLLSSGLAMAWSSLMTLYLQFCPKIAGLSTILNIVGHLLPHSHSHTHVGHDSGQPSNFGSPSINAIWLAGGSILVKEWLYHETLKIAEERQSPVLASNAYHHRVDSLSATVALMVIGGSNILANSTWMDPVGGLLISLMVIQAGWVNFRVTLLELADRGMNDKMKNDVRNAMIRTLDDAQYGGEEPQVVIRCVQGIKSGQNFLVDIELGVSAQWTVQKITELESNLRMSLGNSIKGLKRARFRFVDMNKNKSITFSDEFVIKPNTSNNTAEKVKDKSEENHVSGGDLSNVFRKRK